MFKLDTFEDQFSTDFMPLKYQILVSLFEKTVKKTKQILIHVENIGSPNNEKPIIWINLAADRPAYYFKYDELPNGSKYMLKQIFSMMSVKKILFNATLELPYLASIGLPVKQQIFDILTIDKILNSRKFLSIENLDDVIKFYLSDIYDDLPSLKSEKFCLLEDHIRCFAMCLNLLFPLRKKLINNLEENNLMGTAEIELAKFNDINIDKQVA